VLYKSKKVQERIKRKNGEENFGLISGIKPKIQSAVEQDVGNNNGG
jgi:hypothetical protein